MDISSCFVAVCSIQVVVRTLKIDHSNANLNTGDI